MERLTTKDGRTLAYHRTGSGPTLVCHPGGPGAAPAAPTRPTITGSSTTPSTSRSCANSVASSGCCCSTTRTAGWSRSSTRGSEDFITGPRAAEELAAIPGSETVMLEGSGHMIFVEARERFRQAVLSFLGVGAPA
jgi:hypothetical protein